DASSITHLIDIRYAVGAVPAAAVILSLAIDKLPRPLKFLGATVVVVLLLAVSNVAYSSVITGGRGQSQSVIAFEEAFKRQYKGGNILASTDAVDPVMQWAGIPLKNYIYEGTGRLWKNTLIEPTTVSYVLMSKNVAHDPVQDAYNVYTASYVQRFTVIYQQNGYTILAKKSLHLKPVTVQMTLKSGASVVVDQLQPPSPPYGQINITVQPHDSESTMVRSEIRILDPNHQLSSTEEAYVEGTMVYDMGSNNLIWPGEVISIDVTRLQQLIYQSKSLTSAQLIPWRPYGSQTGY
ncbi:MAG TPA: hypothetical protein VMB52_04000, partial [Verrucomicrobiae bacterium]|nr:hypothetical protein [Verrucomicrobiae bacterium]